MKYYKGYHPINTCSYPQFSFNARHSHKANYCNPKKPAFPRSFTIRDLAALLAGKDMVQELHRHDFFYVLALKKGTGNHEIDFASHDVCDKAVFFMRPRQVHQRVLKAESTGFLMQFRTDFYCSEDNGSHELLRKKYLHKM